MTRFALLTLALLLCTSGRAAEDAAGLWLSLAAADTLDIGDTPGHWRYSLTGQARPMAVKPRTL